jgi:transposase InsO family protein
MVDGLVERFKQPVQVACQLVELPRSTFYYKSQKVDESRLEEDLKAVAGKFPTYVSRRFTYQLLRSPYGYSFNRKHIQRLMRKYKLLQPLRHHKRRTTELSSCLLGDRQDH